VVNINVVNRDCGQSGLWSIGTVVNRDWSIATWSISTRSIGTVVNRDCGQSGLWSISSWSILTWSNRALPLLHYPCLLRYSNAQVERIFSQLNLVKNKTRNRMSVEMTNAILTIRFGLKRNNKCCYDYILPPEVLRKIGSKKAYNREKISNESSSKTTEIDIIDFDFDSRFQI